MTVLKLRRAGTGPNLKLKLNPGISGPPNTLTVGDVVFGSVADVTITGDAPNQVINFYIPRTLYLAEPRIITASSDIVSATDQIIIVQRSGPTATSLLFGPVAERNGLPLFVKDLSTGVTDPTGHTITNTPNGAETIDGDSSYPIYSNSVSRGSALFIPSVYLGGWFRV